MTQNPNEFDWSTRLALAIAGEVRRHRQAQGLSAQQLSDRCSELGLPIQRSVLANLESGRRTTVTVAEVLVLAGALGIAPAQLVFPAGYQPSVEALPDKETGPLNAIDWFAGQAKLGGGLPSRGYTPITSLRRHTQLVGFTRRALADREKLRRDFVASLEEREIRKMMFDEVSAKLNEAEVALVRYRERWRDVRLADRDPDPPEIVELKAEVAKLRKEDSVLREARQLSAYLTHQLKSQEESIAAYGARLANVRRIMREEGWLVPELPDELLDYVKDLPWQEGFEVDVYDEE